MIQLKKLISEQPDPRGSAAVANQNKNLADMKWYTKWYKINLDKTHKKIITYITKIQDFLLDGEKPMLSEKCNVCNFLKKQSYL